MAFWRKSGRSRKQLGSGLIENMIALSMFSAGMAAVMSMTNELVFTNELANEISTATLLVRNKYEEMKTRDPEERLALGISSGQEGPMNATGDIMASGRYTLTWIIDEDEPHSGMEMVTIFVDWTDPRGVTRSYHFHSGFREGWPVPVVVPETDSTHGHGLGHETPSTPGKGCKKK